MVKFDSKFYFSNLKFASLIGSSATQFYLQSTVTLYAVNTFVTEMWNNIYPFREMLHIFYKFMGRGKCFKLRGTNNFNYIGFILLTKKSSGYGVKSDTWRVGNCSLAPLVSLPMLMLSKMSTLTVEWQIVLIKYEMANSLFHKLKFFFDKICCCYKSNKREYTAWGDTKCNSNVALNFSSSLKNTSPSSTRSISHSGNNLGFLRKRV